MVGVTCEISPVRNGREQRVTAAVETTALLPSERDRTTRSLEARHQRVKGTGKMAFKQMMMASIAVLACLVANASAFVAPMTTLATTAARSTASGNQTCTHRRRGG